MNALGTTGTQQHAGLMAAGLVAAMTLPHPTVPSSPSSSTAFINMMSLFLGSSNPATPPQEPSIPNTSESQTTQASAAQIADAMIRSMLGNAGLSNPGLPNAGLGNALKSVTPANTATDQVTTPAGAAAIPEVEVAASGANEDQTAPANIKPLRNAADLPQITLLVVAPAPVVLAPVVPAPTSTTPPAADSKSNATIESNAAPGSITPNTKALPEGKVAFTAILTPANQAPAPAPSNEPQPAPASTEAAVAATSVTPAASATPSTNASPSPAAQGLESQTAIQAAGQKSGDTPSQSRDDSSENPAQASVMPADAKNKISLKQEDTDGLATAAVTSIAPEHSLAITSMTEPDRAVASTTSDAPAAAATPSQSTAEALRTAESNLAAPAPSRAGAAQEITIRIEQPNSSPVDLRVVERSGQLHVDVRTPDAGMQTALRQDLGTLTNSLQRAGYHAETFTPSLTAGRAAASAQTGNRDDHQDSQNRGGTGDSSGGRRQQQQQKRPSTWLEELEDQQ